jgi:hypothetical protein
LRGLRVFARRCAREQVGQTRGAQLDAQIDAIEQRTGEPPAIARHLQAAAAAAARGVPEVAAGAGVHGGHQAEGGRQPGSVADARQLEVPDFEGLAQGFEDLALPFGQLVQEQHAAMGQADLAGHQRRAAAHQPRVAGGVVGGAEGAFLGQPRGPGPEGRAHARDLDALREARRRQQARQGARQGALAGARGPQEQQVVAARRGHQQGLLAERLAAHQIEGRRAQLGPQRARRRLERAAVVRLEAQGQGLAQTGGGEGPRPRQVGRFASGGGRPDQALEARPRHQLGRGQTAGHGMQAPVDADLAQEQAVLQGLRRCMARGAAQRQGQRQVEQLAALLGGRWHQIHVVAPRGQGQALGGQGRQQARAALADDRIGKPGEHHLHVAPLAALETGFDGDQLGPGPAQGGALDACIRHAPRDRGWAQPLQADREKTGRRARRSDRGALPAQGLRSARLAAEPRAIKPCGRKRRAARGPHSALPSGLSVRPLRCVGQRRSIRLPADHIPRPREARASCTTTSPLTYAQGGESRNSASAATSSARAKRPAGSVRGCAGPARCGRLVGQPCRAESAGSGTDLGFRTTSALSPPYFSGREPGDFAEVACGRVVFGAQHPNGRLGSRPPGRA